jgi:hypothetical protein
LVVASFLSNSNPQRKKNKADAEMDGPRDVDITRTKSS